MTTETLTITPTKAKELLEINQSNRPLRGGYVSLLAREMAEGRWRDMNGDTIRISKTSQLLDGQHRLHAVIQAKHPIKTIVVSGIDPDANDSIDIGLRRQASDVLALDGVKNAVVLSAIIKFVKANGLGAGMLSPDTYTTNREVAEIYESDKVFWDNCASNAAKWYRDFRILNTKAWGGLYALAMKQSKFPVRVNEFFNSLASGQNCSEIVLSLRKKLINDTRATAKKYTLGYKRDMIQSYFNGFIKGQKFPYYNPKKEWL